MLIFCLNSVRVSNFINIYYFDHDCITKHTYTTMCGDIFAVRWAKYHHADVKVRTWRSWNGKGGANDVGKGVQPRPSGAISSWPSPLRSLLKCTWGETPAICRPFFVQIQRLYLLALAHPASWLLPPATDSFPLISCFASYPLSEYRQPFNFGARARYHCRFHTVKAGSQSWLGKWFLFVRLLQ